MKWEDKITSVSVQILDKEGEIFGTGILLSESLIVTCAHVIEAIHPNITPGAISGNTIEMYIPCLDDEFLADVVFWDKENDIAGLELKDPIPDDKKNELFSTLLLTRLQTLRERKVSVFGFSINDEDDHDQGRWAAGVVRGQQLGHLMQMDPAGDAAYLVEPGFSGGPVVDVALEKIVGILHGYKPEKGVAYFISVTVLAAVWSELNGLVDEPQSAMAHFVVGSDEIKRIRDTFEPPKPYAKIQKHLENNNMAWLKGPLGIGKRTCAIKLAHDSGKPVFVIPPSETWGKLADLDLQQTALIFPDCLGRKRFERESLDDEWAHIEQLKKPDKKNLLIFTADDKTFEEARQQTDLQDWSQDGLFTITEKDYASPVKDKTKKPLYAIYNKLLTYANEHKRLTSEQMTWGVALTTEASNHPGIDREILVGIQQMFQKQLDNLWVPSDIKRFVNHLSSIASLDELRESLRKEAELESQIHAWFTLQSNSIRVFLLALSLLAGSTPEEFWPRYCQIVKLLKEFDPALAVSPLGMLRQQTFPYVTTTNELDFASERAARAVLREVVRMYREYLLELTHTCLTDWSQADVEKAALENEISPNERIRNSMAEVIGEALKYGQEGLLVGLIQAWAKNYWRQISSSAALALQYASTEAECMPVILDLLDRWISDQSGSEDAYRRRWTATASLWRICLVDSAYSSKITQRLQRLARDQNSYVLEGVARAVHNLLGEIPFNQLEPIYSRLARAKVRKDTLNARSKITSGLIKLTRLASQNENIKLVFDLLENWANSDSENAQQTAVYALLFGKDFPSNERLRLFGDIHQKNPDHTFKILILTLETEKTRSSAIEALNAFWLPGKKRSLFIASLANVHSETLQDFVVTTQRISSPKFGKGPLPEEILSLLRDVSQYMVTAVKQRIKSTADEWVSQFEQNPFGFLEKLHQQISDEDLEDIDFIEKVLIAIPEASFSNLTSQIADQIIETNDPQPLVLCNGIAEKSQRFKQVTQELAQNVFNLVYVNPFLSAPSGLLSLHPSTVYHVLLIMYQTNKSQVNTAFAKLTEGFWAELLWKSQFVNMLKQAAQSEKHNGHSPNLNFIPANLRADIEQAVNSN